MVEPLLHVGADDPVFMSHRDATARESAYRRRQGRSAPELADCAGTFRLVEDDGEPSRVIQCDRCGAMVGIPRSALDREHAAAEAIARSRLPMRMVEATYVQLAETELARRLLRTFVEAWHSPDRPKPPLLWGEPGRGKTHLLSLTAATLARTKLVGVRYWSSTDLLDTLQRSYRSGGVCVDWEVALDVPLLVLDDLGAERLTEWTRERLGALIDHRYLLAVPMLIATNVPPAAWPDEFGDRAASRLAGMTNPIELGGSDWRQRPIPSDAS